MPTISFSVKSTGMSKRKKPPNPYSNAPDGPPLWKVVLGCDRIPNRFIDLWFENEPQARTLRKGSISLSELFGVMEPLDLKFKVDTITKERRFLQTNRYTDRPDWMDGWAVSFSDDRDNRYADLWYEQEGEARKFKIGGVYGPIDFLRVFRILVLIYPEAEYAAAYYTEGFFDSQGYHKPGPYPRGHYPAGYFTGEEILLEASSGEGLGHFGYILITG